MLRLKTLPQPEIFLHLLPGFAQAQILEHLINRIFAGSALTQLQPLSGKKLLFCTPGGELELIMLISPERIRISHHRGESPNLTPDATIRGDLLALTALCLGLEDSDSLFFSRRLLMTGDTSAGLMFKNILTNLDFDLYAELEKQLGSSMAETLWKMGSRAIGAVEYIDQRVADASIIIGERLGLSPVEQVKSLESELQRVQGELDRLKLQSGRRLRQVAS
ncbi:MAG: SCP2 sterol-binding domain-containing protein [Mariprofundaceae bacterium]